MRQLLIDKGFAIDPQPLPAGLSPVFWAFRKGKGSDAYFFVFHDPDLAQLKEQHERARALANGRFKLPKALRIRHPHLLTVIVMRYGVEQAMIDWVTDAPRHTAWKGEMCHVLLLDVAGGQLHHQAIRTRYENLQVGMYGHLDLGRELLGVAQKG